MKFTSLKRSLGLAHVLRRYNRRYKTNIEQKDLRVLFLIKSEYLAPNRLKILTILAKCNIAVNYTGLQKTLELLIELDFVKLSVRSGRKVYGCTSNGVEFLVTIETWVRKFRIDKVKS